MDRLEKKCLIGSACTHGFLAVLLVVGSAFLLPKDKPPEAQPQVRIIPSILIDKALAGGGGNPNVAKTDDQQKGDTTRPQPKAPEPEVAKVQPKPPEPTPEPPKAAPKDVVKPTKAKVTETAKKPEIEPKKSESSTPALSLKPTTRSQMAKATAKSSTSTADADAKRRAELAQKITKTLGGAQESLRAGFKSGTKMEVWGPGGEAYAGYEAFVQAVYDDAWETAHLMDYDGAVRVSVTIRRTGDVISAHIVRGSGTSLVDKSVQRALDRVKFVAPFPKDTKDEQRTFNITFDLKAKRILG